MSADPAVRRAVAADLAELDRLSALAANGVRDGRGGPQHLLREGHRVTALADAIGSPDRLVLIGLYGEVPVGDLVAELVHLPDGTMGGRVTELFVEPEARELGVGEALMDEAIAWCREHGCTGIDALALPGDRATKNFFETFGLVARAIIVHRAL